MVKSALLISVFLVGFLLLVSGISFSANAEEAVKKDMDGLKGYTTAYPIRIDNNDEFNVSAWYMHWPGSGTEDDPFIISGYEIDAKGNGSAIYIGNTTLYFVIQDCYLHGAKKISLPYFAGAGIILYNVSGTRHIDSVKNNIISDNDYGMYIRDTHGENIVHNDINSNTYNGIWIYHSHYIYPKYNNISHNGNSGILGYSYYASIVEYNNCTYNGHHGIALTGGSLSENNLIYRNNCSSNGAAGIYISGSTTSPAQGNNVNYNVLYNNTYGIETYKANDTFIYSNTCINNTQDGIYLYAYSTNTTVEKNHCHQNHKYGLVLYQSSSSLPVAYSKVYENNFSFNALNGIYLYNSDHNEIYNNILYNNTGYGISIYGGSYNTVYSNSFYFNHGSTDTYDSSHVQASDSGTNNIWNLASGGNFWYDWQAPDSNHDGFVDNPYSIGGTAGSQDELPLASDVNIPEFSVMLILPLLVLLAVILRRRT